MAVALRFMIIAVMLMDRFFCAPVVKIGILHEGLACMKRIEEVRIVSKPKSDTYCMNRQIILRLT